MATSLPRSRAFASLLVTLVLWACSTDGGTGTNPPPQPVPTSITLNKTTVSFTAFGETDQLTATVKDQDGKVMTGQTVTWSSGDTTVATVNASGLVTSVADGSDTVTAASGSLTADASVTVLQAPGQVGKPAGDAQSATVAGVLPDSLVVEVADAQGNVMAGVTVNFAVLTGGGSVSPASGATDGDGLFATEWTLGTVAGTQRVTAIPATGSGTAVFTVTANADVADTVYDVSGNNQSVQEFTLLPDSLVIRVDDQYGNPVLGHSIDFNVTGGGGTLTGGGTAVAVATDANGEASTTWTLGVAGPQTVNANAGALKGSPVAFDATALTPSPSSVEIDDGDGQTGLVGVGTNVAPSVIVRDAIGSLFPGASVTFTVATGGGSVTSGTVTSDANGVATVGSWILGGAVGTNTLDATVTGTAITPVTFTATGQDPAFNIAVQLISSATPAQQDAFDSAEVFWERLVFGDLTPQPVNIPAGSCGVASLPAVDETIDDVVIFAELKFIDGPFGILGQAGPCVIRSGGLPALGIMVLDTSDLSMLEASGELETVILHEMGHVLGFGTLWSNFGLLENPSDTSGPIVDTHFDGPFAIAAFDAAGGTTYVGGAKVPAENDNTVFGLGSLNGHWRESVFSTELMTPALNGGMVNPLSIVSVASLRDMGYAVAYANSDSYVLPVAPAVFGLGTGVLMLNDIWPGPIVVVDPGGRIIRVLR